MPAEKRPKAGSINFCEPGQADAGNREVMLWSLMLCITHDGRVKDLNKWASAAVMEYEAATTQMNSWKPSDEIWPKNRKWQVSEIFVPLVIAHKDFAWPVETVDSIALAMQAWRGDGQVDNMTGITLRNYISTPPRGIRKRDPPPRYRTWSVVRVARLLLDHGPELRRLLKLDRDCEEAKPLIEVAAERAERIEELEEEKAALEARTKELEKAARKLQDAWRKAAGRLKDAGKKKTEAVRAEREKQQQMQKEQQVEVQAKAKEEAEAATEGELERKRRLTNAANKRARKAEGTVKTLGRKVERLKEELQELMEDADDEMDVDDEEETEEDPVKRLPFEFLPRRDEHGRWQAESPELRSARMAQVARGVSPSTVTANIEDIISLLMPGVELPAPCERSMRQLRGEVTIASEAMAAWKFAKAKRILFAGWDESTKFGDSVFAMTFLVEHFDGSREEVCLRGLTLLPAGGTSKAVLEHIETRIFTHARRILGLWITEHEKANGAGSWAAAGGPPVENIGLHRLCEDTVRAACLLACLRCLPRYPGS